MQLCLFTNAWTILYYYFYIIVFYLIIISKHLLDIKTKSLIKVLKTWIRLCEHSKTKYKTLTTKKKHWHLNSKVQENCRKFCVSISYRSSTASEQKLDHKSVVLYKKARMLLIFLLNIYQLKTLLLTAFL